MAMVVFRLLVMPWVVAGKCLAGKTGYRCQWHLPLFDKVW